MEFFASDLVWRSERCESASEIDLSPRREGLEDGHSLDIRLCLDGRDVQFPQQRCHPGRRAGDGARHPSREHVLRRGGSRGRPEHFRAHDSGACRPARWAGRDVRDGVGGGDIIHTNIVTS